MITFRKRWSVVASTIVLGLALASRAVAVVSATEIGRPLDGACRVNVAVNTGRSFPSTAIETIVGHGGTILVTPVGDQANPSLTVQLTVTGWTLYEDSDLWGDLRDYEVECGLANEVYTVNLPMIAN